MLRGSLKAQFCNYSGRTRGQIRGVRGNRGSRRRTLGQWPDSFCARRLGARGIYPDHSQAADLRFAVWAPNATTVDVVFGKPDNGYISDDGTGIDPAAKALLEVWGIYHPPTYEGPTGISTVVLDAAERREMQHVGFMGQAPHYLPDSENPAAIEALVSYVARLLNLTMDMSHFAETIQDFRVQCDRAVARDRDTREHVRKLEQEYDAAAGEEQPPLPGGKLDSDRLMRDVIVYLTCLHETGHALGLPHTAAFADIMYSFQFGGDIEEYFGRYRRKLEGRGDIAKNSGMSAADRRYPAVRR